MIQRRVATRRGRCLQWFKEFDATKIKPLLLYNYDSNVHKQRKEFYNLLFKDGTKLEDKFVEYQVNYEKTNRMSAMTAKPYEKPKGIVDDAQKLDSDYSG